MKTEPSQIWKEMTISDYPGGGYAAHWGDMFDTGNTPEEAKLALLDKIQKLPN